jgi:hypothetical protein
MRRGIAALDDCGWTGVISPFRLRVHRLNRGNGAGHPDTAPPGPLAASSRPGRYLSLLERQRIAALRGLGHTVREIARRPDRSASTVSREFRRNTAIGTVLGDRHTRPSPPASPSPAPRPSTWSLALSTALPRHLSDHRPDHRYPLCPRRPRQPELGQTRPAAGVGCPGWRSRRGDERVTTGRYVRTRYRQ